jgi:hypothetical protein
MPLELGVFVPCELLIKVGADEVDQLPAGDVGLSLQSGLYSIGCRAPGRSYAGLDVLTARMWTTVDLDDDLLRQAKQRAAAAGVPLRAYIEDAIRARLLPRPTGRRRFTLDVLTAPNPDLLSQVFPGQDVYARAHARAIKHCTSEAEPAETCLPVRGGASLELPIVEGKAPPAVDVADRNALYDLMERE